MITTSAAVALPLAAGVQRSFALDKALASSTS